METKSKKILQSSFFLILVFLTGTSFIAQKETLCTNFGIIHESLSYLQGFVWPVEYSSSRQLITKQNLKNLPSNSLCDAFANTTAFENLDCLDIRFRVNGLFYCSKYVTNENTFAIREAKRVILSDVKKLEPSQLSSINTLDRNNCYSCVRKTESEIFSTTVIKNVTHFNTCYLTVMENLKQIDKNLSFVYTRDNRITPTLNLYIQKPTSVKYTTNNQPLLLSKMYDTQTQFYTGLNNSVLQRFTGASVTQEYVATPSLDIPTLQNSLRVTILASPSQAKAEERFIPHHTSIDSALELRGSIRSQPSFSIYNEESSSMTSTPVISNSAAYSYRSTFSIESEEISTNYSLATSSTVFSSRFSAETPLPAISSSTNVFVSSVLDDSISSSDSF